MRILNFLYFSSSNAFGVLLRCKSALFLHMKFNRIDQSGNKFKESCDLQKNNLTCFK